MYLTDLVVTLQNFTIEECDFSPLSEHSLGSLQLFFVSVVHSCFHIRFFRWSLFHNIHAKIRVLVICIRPSLFARGQSQGGTITWFRGPCWLLTSLVHALAFCLLCGLRYVIRNKTHGAAMTEFTFLSKHFTNKHVFLVWPFVSAEALLQKNAKDQFREAHHRRNSVGPVAAQVRTWTKPASSCICESHITCLWSSLYSLLA